MLKPLSAITESPSSSMSTSPKFGEKAKIAIGGSFNKSLYGIVPLIFTPSCSLCIRRSGFFYKQYCAINYYLCIGVLVE